MKTSGQIGYEAYVKSIPGTRATWEELCEGTPFVAKAWEAAADAILEFSVPSSLPRTADEVPDSEPSDVVAGKHMAITVNGVRHFPPPRPISYEDVVAIAGKSGTPTVVWRVHGEARSGTMFPGCPKLNIELGLIFNVAHTDRA